MVCEQINFWLGGFKYAMKHMNVYRYNFFLYIILNELNNVKINNRLSTFHPTFSASIAEKRNIHLIEDDFLD
jgi:hypothetical protein